MQQQNMYNKFKQRKVQQKWQRRARKVRTGMAEVVACFLLFFPIDNLLVAVVVVECVYLPRCSIQERSFLFVLSVCFPKNFPYVS